jgi:hypothetical protein
MSRLTASYIIEQARKHSNESNLDEGVVLTSIIAAIKTYLTYGQVKLFVETVLPRMSDVMRVVESAASLENDLDKEAIKAAASEGSSLALQKINNYLEENLDFWDSKYSELIVSLVGFLGKMGVLTAEKVNANNLLKVLKRIDYVYRDFISKMPKSETFMSKILGTKTFSTFEFFALLIELFRGTVTNKEAIDVLIQDEEVKKVLSGMSSDSPESLKESQIKRFKQLAGILHE